MTRRGTAWLVGGLAFVLAFMLIVGAAVVFLVVRGVRGSEDAHATTASTSARHSASAGPSSAAADFCWLNPDQERTSTNPPGRIRGGGIETAVPASFSAEDTTPRYLPAVSDATGVFAPVDTNWAAQIVVATVTWQPGQAYPGAQAVAQRMLDCITGSSAPWAPTVSARHTENAGGQEVTIGGMHGYRATVTEVFDRSTLTRTSASDLVAIVLDAPGGPALFFAEVPHEDAALHEQEKAAEDALVAV